MKYEIVGRKKELKTLDRILLSKEAEFVALYGRRRVGKTYLVILLSLLPVFVNIFFNIIVCG